jgi:Transglutaminase-like superfamily
MRLGRTEGQARVRWGLMIAAAFRRAWRLSPQEWRLLLEAGRLAVFMEAALRTVPFDALLVRLAAADARAPIVEGFLPATRLAACEQAVGRVYRLLRPLTRTCLKESLVLLRMLRKRGVKVRLCIGVRKEGDRLAAHAWIEQDGTPLQPTDASYTRLPMSDVPPAPTGRGGAR